MCSSTRGPAIWPSLVTWPTSSTAVPLALAKRTSSAVHSRSCDTAPGADFDALRMHGLDGIDDQHARRDPLRGADDVFDAGLGDQPRGGASRAPGAGREVRPASRIPRPWRTAPAPAHCSAAAACSISVDFPIPGSPPIKVTEPGTRPPPSTRSSSRRARRQAALLDGRLGGQRGGHIGPGGAAPPEPPCGNLPPTLRPARCSIRRRQRTAPAISEQPLRSSGR